MNNLPLSIQVTKKIEDDIVFGNLPPGTKLDEQELCDRYNVSRTPVREALKLLAADGLVEIRPRRGAIVPKIEPLVLCEMFEVMAELEGMCGRLAARRIQAQEKENLIKLHHNCKQYVLAEDSESYYEENKNFHFAIYHASHNSFLIEQASSLHKRLHPYRRLQLRVHNRMPQSYAEHEALLQAILDGDDILAEQLLKAHVSIQGAKFTDFIASLNVLA
jgi:DNA-binding GntR family transcriptional regulator